MSRLEAFAESLALDVRAEASVGDAVSIAMRRIREFVTPAFDDAELWLDEPAAQVDTKATRRRWL